MDIPKLQTNPPVADQLTQINTNPTTPKNLPLYLIVVSVSIISGFFLSRFFPTTNNSSELSLAKPVTLSQETTAQDLEVGVIYGQTGKNFSDTATGIVRSGSINNVGTHILEREGGQTQWASLTSSAVDLDLFIDKKVEVKGETNSSNKASWLLDVGTIKILE